MDILKNIKTVTKKINIGKKLVLIYINGINIMEAKRKLNKLKNKMVMHFNMLNN